MAGDRCEVSEPDCRDPCQPVSSPQGPLAISDPDNSVEVGYFDTAPDEIGCCQTWSNYPYFESGIIPVTAENAGVFFVRKHEAPVP